jgi:hypothetical protein
MINYFKHVNDSIHAAHVRARHVRGTDEEGGGGGHYYANYRQVDLSAIKEAGVLLAAQQRVSPLSGAYTSRTYSSVILLEI